MLCAKHGGSLSWVGSYHLVASGQTSWWAYACWVIEWARQQGAAVRVAPEAVVAIPTSDYPTPAKRPSIPACPRPSSSPPSV